MEKNDLLERLEKTIKTSSLYITVIIALNAIGFLVAPLFGLWFLTYIIGGAGDSDIKTTLIFIIIAIITTAIIISICRSIVRLYKKFFLKMIEEENFQKMKKASIIELILSILLFILPIIEDGFDNLWVWAIYAIIFGAIYLRAVITRIITCQKLQELYDEDEEDFE